MTQNANISISGVLQYCRKKRNLCFFLFLAFIAFCVISVVPIMIQTCSGPQNDRLNFGCMKDFFIVGTKIAINGRKLAIYQMQSLMINL